MKIKEIIIHKARTISVDGLLGRDKYRKIEVGLVTNTDEGEDGKEAIKKTIAVVDVTIQGEILKIKEDVNKAKKGTKL